MIRYVLVLLGVAVAVHAQSAGNMVDINNKTYFVGNTMIGVNWNDAEKLCTNKSMSIVGLETQEEQDNLNIWFRTNGINGKWWTNGAYRFLQGDWEWGTSGVTFQRNDNNWSRDPVNEPDGDAARWTLERVALSAVTNQWFSDSMTTELNHAICE